MTTLLDTLDIHPVDPARTDRPGNDAGLAVVPGDEHVNVNGGVHGGLMATLIDAVMGRAVRAQLDPGKSAVTVSMTVTYLTGASLGDELVASAELRRAGSSLSVVEADVVRVSDGECIAHGVGTYSVIDLPDDA